MKGTSVSPTATRRAQRGVVLYVSLLLLLVLTLIGLAVTRNTTFDERMAATQRDHDLAFQAAEAALRDGESMLQNIPPGEFNNTDGHYDGTATITWQSADWTGTSQDPALRTLPYEGTFNPAPAHRPRFYFVRTAQTGASPDQNVATDSPDTPATVYKVIAKGWGLNANDAVVLESTFVVRDAGSGGRLSWQQLQ